MYKKQNKGFIQIIVLGALAFAFFIVAKGKIETTPTAQNQSQPSKQTLADKIKENQAINKNKPKKQKEPWLEALDSHLADLFEKIKKYGPTDMLQRLQSGAPSVIEEMAPQIGVSGASFNPVENITPQINGLLLNIIKH